MKNYFFLIVPTYSRELGYIRNVFGPYVSEEYAMKADDDVGPGEIDELPVNTLEEATEILNRKSV